MCKEILERLEKQVDKELMIQEESMVQCPICGEISEGAMECGCFNDIHYGRD